MDKGIYISFFIIKIPAVKLNIVALTGISQLKMTDLGHPFSDDTREKVGVIVYDSAGKLLLVEGITGKISLPKGGRLRGETDLEGALREAWEETGINLEDIQYISKIQLIWGTYFVYKLDVLGKDMPLLPQPGEVVKILWKNPKSFWLKMANMNCDLKYYINDYLSKGWSRSMENKVLYIDDTPTQ